MYTSFNIYYDLAKKYFEHFKNLSVPRSFRTFDGINFDENGFPLGHFIANQRYSYNYDEEYPMDRYNKLNDIAMNWSVNKR